MKIAGLPNKRFISKHVSNSNIEKKNVENRLHVFYFCEYSFLEARTGNSSGFHFAVRKLTFAAKSLELKCQLWKELWIYKQTYQHFISFSHWGKSPLEVRQIFYLKLWNSRVFSNRFLLKSSERWHSIFSGHSCFLGTLIFAEKNRDFFWSPYISDTYIDT